MQQVAALALNLTNGYEIRMISYSKLAMFSFCQEDLLTQSLSYIFHSVPNEDVADVYNGETLHSTLYTILCTLDYKMSRYEFGKASFHMGKTEYLSRKTTSAECTFLIERK